MDNAPKPMSPEEEIKKWREENADKLNIKNEFMTMPDGTVAEVTEENKELYHEQAKDLKS